MLVISCYIMVLFLFFGTCLFCYSYLHLLHHYARNTMVTNGNLEFDGEKCIVLERQISIDNLRTSKAWYSYKTQLSLK